MQNKLSHSQASRIAGELFGKIFSRDADKAGYAYVLDCLESGTKSVQQLMVEMIVSDEFVDKFTDLNGAQQTARKLHEVVLGRSIDDPSLLRNAARRLMRLGLKQYVEEIARLQISGGSHAKR